MSAISRGSASTAPANLVRLGPLPEHSGSLARDQSRVIRGNRVYQSVLHGSISGTVYLVPALGIELMASGPLAQRVIDSLAPSIRRVVLQDRSRVSIPTSWRSVTFSGLRIKVPPAWHVSRSTLAFGCEQTDIAFSATSVVLDTDSNAEAIPCPYIPPPRLGSDGIQVDAGSAAAPNILPKHARRLVLNGLEMLLDNEYPFSVLVFDVLLPGRSMPIEVRIGLGTANSAAAVLRSMRAAA
ncbi:MAG TPA: hypothetical protein VKR27_04810 [Acidimicrobiales bacterium]|nr:hypothetical protein [Acidimicrobiales bacterium]